ncbi:MAG: Mut7-C RNAse domain-containing protein [Thermoplasmatota archaeon]
MRFLCDQMLGTLAKWLRILGHDTVYARDGDDDSLLEQAAAEGRVLLTRDRELAERAADAVLIESTELEEQLRRVVAATGIEIREHAMLSRCTVCNTPVVQVEKSKVKEEVPAHAYEAHESFWTCPGCGRVYWKGTHWDDMRRFVRQLMQ